MSELISRQRLKPCPFCGGKASTTKRERWKDESCTYSRPDYGASCQECYAKGYQYYSTVEEAIEAWNKRADQPTADVPDTNVGKWIPCSEGTLPADKRTVPVTVDSPYGGRHITTATYYTKKGVVDDYEWTGRGFYQYDSEYGYGRLDNVVAWLNVEPYKGVE